MKDRSEFESLISTQALIALIADQNTRLFKENLKDREGYWLDAKQIERNIAQMESWPIEHPNFKGVIYLKDVEPYRRLQGVSGEREVIGFSELMLILGHGEDELSMFKTVMKRAHTSAKYKGFGNESIRQKTPRTLAGEVLRHLELLNRYLSAPFLLVHHETLHFVHEGVLLRVSPYSEGARRLRHFIEELFSLYYGDKNLRPAEVDDRFIKALLRCKMDLPQVDTIMTLPGYTKEGVLVTEPGYHEESKVFLQPGIDIKVPKRITKKRMEASRDFLLDELFGDFPFEDVSGKAHALSALLQTPMRQNFSGPSPNNNIDAPRPGTGKTLLAHVICAVAGSRVDLAITKSKEEVRKSLMSALLSDAKVILMDNVKIRVSNQHLEAMLTTTVHTDRMLGKSLHVKVVNDKLWLFTSNNAELSPDLARRTVRIGLDAECEHPSMRTGFKHPNLLGWVNANRDQIIEAMVTLIGYWHQQGRPVQDEIIMGSFEGWSRVMGGLLKCIGVEGFLENFQETISSYNPEEVKLRALFKWWAKHIRTPATAGTLMKRVPEGFREDLGLTSTTAIGTKLRKLKGAVYGSLKLHVKHDSKKNSYVYSLVQV